DCDRRVRQGGFVRLRAPAADQGARQVMRRVSVLPLALVLSIAAATLASAQAPKGIETFDAAWTIIRDSHFDPGMNSVGWQAVRKELSPRAASARSDGELRDVIREMLGRLGLSHFALIPSGGSSSDPVKDLSGSPGFDVRLVDSSMLVTSVDPNGGAFSA